MDIVIESTKQFEKAIAKLDPGVREQVITKINKLASSFSAEKADVYHQLHHLRWPLLPNGYESSLYTLKSSGKWRVILAIDEDPIFAQTILTLFRVFKADEIDQEYQSLAESLYQEFKHQNR